jgi:acetylornithine/succinyldiaminopimelate/putrescine aminotransferase
MGREDDWEAVATQAAEHGVVVTQECWAGVTTGLDEAEGPCVSCKDTHRWPHWPKPVSAAVWSRSFLGNCIHVAPPLNVNDSDVATGLAILDEALAEADTFLA